MNPFVRFIFLLILLSSSLGFAILVVFNLRANSERNDRLAQERTLIDTTYKALDRRTMYAVLTVERQETVMNPDNHSEVNSTTLLMGICDDAFHAPKFVQRIIIPGDKVTVTGIALAFSPKFDYEQTLLATHVFYLFDTIKGEADPEPFDINPVGSPPLALRHNSPQSTDFEKELWRPIWNIMPSQGELLLSTSYDTIAQKERVKRFNLPSATTSVSTGNIYQLFVYSTGVNIRATRDSLVLTKMLKLARDQDEEALTGIKPETTTQP